MVDKPKQGGQAAWGSRGGDSGILSASVDFNTQPAAPGQLAWALEPLQMNRPCNRAKWAPWEHGCCAESAATCWALESSMPSRDKSPFLLWDHYQSSQLCGGRKHHYRLICTCHGYLLQG